MRAKTAYFVRILAQNLRVFFSGMDSPCRAILPPSTTAGVKETALALQPNNREASNLPTNPNRGQEHRFHFPIRIPTWNGPPLQPSKAPRQQESSKCSPRRGSLDPVS